MPAYKTKTGFVVTGLKHEEPLPLWRGDVKVPGSRRTFKAIWDETGACQHFYGAPEPLMVECDDLDIAEPTYVQEAPAA